ncbi:MAG: HAMP domain-containing histidine kinase, partial [Chitinophagaceae bacterium]
LIHDIKSPLHFLNSVADHLTKNFATTSPEKNREIAKEISTSLNRLYLFTQDFAIWLNASEPHQLQNASRINMSTTIDESIAMYDEIITRKGLIILKQVHVTTMFGDAPMIKSIIRNLLDNAVKNTSNGRISIAATTSTDERSCEITIADEGKGLTDDQLEELNHYLQSEQELLSFSSSQFGHKVIKDFIRKLSGSIRYQHNKPNGIIVTISLPSASEQI